jgi:mRNA interferase MazF
MRRGEIWWANLPAPWGRRPVLLLARNGAYYALNSVMVVPLTSTVRRLPTTVVLDPRLDGVPKPCVVSLDSILTIRKDWLDTLMVALPPQKMQAIEQAIHTALDLSN